VLLQFIGSIKVLVSIFLTECFMSAFSECTGQKGKGSGSPSAASPAKLPKFQTSLPLSNSDEPTASSDRLESGPIGPLSCFQGEELCIEGIFLIMHMLITFSTYHVLLLCLFST
jgi:hypothetical protein